MLVDFKELFARFDAVGYDIDQVAEALADHFEAEYNPKQ